MSNSGCSCNANTYDVNPTKSDIENVPPAPDDTATSTASEMPLDISEFNVFDPAVDYNIMPQYTVTCVVNFSSDIFMPFYKGIEHWAAKTNCNFLGVAKYVNGLDELLKDLPGLVERNDGLIVDINPWDMFGRVVELLDELNAVWMCAATQARDYSDPMLPPLHPLLVSDKYDTGYLITQKLYEYRDHMWPEVDNNICGWIILDISTRVPDFQQVLLGIEENLSIYEPEIQNSDRYFPVNVSTDQYGNLLDNPYAVSELVKKIIDENHEIKFWLVFSAIDIYARNAASALYEMGLSENSIIITLGNDLINAFVSGQQELAEFASYIATLCTPDIIMAELVWFGLYAMMSGQKTADSLWSEWVNKRDNPSGNTYASRILPSYWVDRDNYKDFLAWIDVYAQTSEHPEYARDVITRDSFSTYVKVPTYY